MSCSATFTVSAVLTASVEKKPISHLMKAIAVMKSTPVAGSRNTWMPIDSLKIFVSFNIRAVLRNVMKYTVKLTEEYVFLNFVLLFN